MSGITRGKRILNLLTEACFTPKYESTIGLNTLERDLALKRWRDLNSVNSKNNICTTIQDKFKQKRCLFFKTKDYNTSNKDISITRNQKECINTHLEYNLMEKKDNKIDRVPLSKDKVNSDQMYLNEYDDKIDRVPLSKDKVNSDQMYLNEYDDKIDSVPLSKDKVNSDQMYSKEYDDIIGHTNLKQQVRRNLALSFNVDELNDSDPYDTDSGEEYVPSSDDVDSDEYISENTPNSPRDSTVISSTEYKNCDSESNNKYIHIAKNKSVPTSTVVGSYTKIFFCVFCKERVKRFAKHLIDFHKTEEEVNKILHYPPKSIERQRLITNLRNAGTFMYNNADELNKGDLIVSRRPNPKKKRKSDDYSPCKYCKAYFVTNNIYRHYKICTLNPSRNSRNAKSDSSAFQMQLNYKNLNLHHNVSILLKNLRDDEVAKVIKEDFLLLKLASFLCNKFCTEDHLKYHCRQKLRQLARLLITIKKENPHICELRECIQPKNFEIVIKGVQVLCGLNWETGEYKNPSLANHLGIYLKECTKIFYNICIIEENHTRKQLVDDFKYLLSFEYGAAISKSARKTVEQSKWNKPKLLPLISDIKLFRDHLVAKAEFSLEKLREEEFSYIEWRNLMEVTGALVLLFNRKRPGESERILLQNYKSKQRIEKDSEDYKALTTLEKVLCDTFSRIEIQGKRSRRVPVLLRKIHIRFIDAFLQFRSKAGVSDENKYLFGLDKNKFIRLTDVIRRESALCDAKQPHLLRATFLRKQVATTSQLLELNDNDMQMLADFMGHDLQIHKDYYRTPEMTLQIAKLSKLLIAVDNGDVLKYKGKNFQTMDISLNTDAEVDVEVYTDISKEQTTDISLNTEAKEDIYTDLCKELPTDPVFNDADMDSIETENIYANSSLTNNVNSYRALQKKKVKPHVTKYTEKFVRRITWRTPEKKIVREIFKAHLENFTLPKEKDIRDAKKSLPELSRRTPAQIKAWINNENNRRLRENSRMS